MKACLLGLAAAMVLAAQGGPPPDLYFTPGRVIARGTNATAEGFYRLKTYRIEEVRLASPVTVEIAGRQQATEKAWRVIVTGEKFPVRALPATVWAGDVPVGKAQESRDLTEVVAVTFDPAAIREGATLSFSFGAGRRQAVREPIHYTVAP